MATEQRWIFDSSAILALLLDEPGAAVAAAVRPRAAVLTVTLAESATKLIRRFGDPDRAQRLLRALGLEVVPWTEPLVWQGLDLCDLAWTAGLSLADRACLTAARVLHRTALTADRAWIRACSRLLNPPAIELIR